MYKDLPVYPNLHESHRCPSTFTLQAHCPVSALQSGAVLPLELQLHAVHPSSLVVVVVKSYAITARQRWYVFSAIQIHDFTRAEVSFNPPKNEATIHNATTLCHSELHQVHRSHRISCGRRHRMLQRQVKCVVQSQSDVYSNAHLRARSKLTEVSRFTAVALHAVYETFAVALPDHGCAVRYLLLMARCVDTTLSTCTRYTCLRV